jgi:hypothetical protein
MQNDINKKSRVVQFAEEVVQEKFMSVTDLTSKFSILLSEQDMMRLDFLAKTLGFKRAEFARNLIKESLTDIESHFNLGPEYYTAIFNAESVEELDSFADKILPVGTITTTTKRKGKEHVKESEITKDHYE